MEGPEAVLIHELPAPSQRAHLFRRSAAALIESVGIATFEDDLFRLVHEAIDCIHMNAFVFGRDDGRALVVAGNEGPSQVAREVGVRYIKHYWQFDPAHARLKQLDPGFRMIETRSNDIPNAEYRDDCYTAVRIAERISLCETRDDSTLRANFYHPEGFTSEHKEAIADAAGLLMPLLWRHAKGCDRILETYEDFDLRLAQVAPTLTERERQVCALIALGVSSEGIGLRLGISINTVLTYRKRAYARLGITSQNELLRLAGGPVRMGTATVN
jgi:DNA-binding CsgD family transcriptional regulator